MLNSASAFSFADVPEYVEASARENQVRSIACLGINETICGIEVRPLNAAHLALLSLIKYPFHGGFTSSQLCGTPENNFEDGKPDIISDIMRFLWIVSPMFESGAATRKHWWNRRTARDRFNETFAPITKEPVTKVVSEILRYVEDAYIDTDDSPRDAAEKSGWAFQISLAVELSKHHGYRVDFWNPNCPVDKNPLFVPLKIVTQLRKYRAACEGQAISNRSDRMLEAGTTRN